MDGGGEMGKRELNKTEVLKDCTRKWQADLQIHREIQGTQKDFTKEEQSWRNHSVEFQNLLESHGDQDNMVLA